MRYPQLLVYESDGRIAELFRRQRQEEKSRRFALREPRGQESCLRLLRRGGTSALILKVGKDLVRELTLLERVTWLCPETAVIVAGDTENAVLAELAWDLGARFVLFPPLPREWLPALVDGFLRPPSGTGKEPPPREPGSDYLLLPGAGD
jgi:hypothetical protein